MTTDKIISLAKEKLGKDITEQEAQDFLNGKLALPDEALELISGGSGCSHHYCRSCYMPIYEVKDQPGTYYCQNCGRFV